MSICSQNPGKIAGVRGKLTVQLFCYAIFLIDNRIIIYHKIAGIRESTILIVQSFNNLVKIDGNNQGSEGVKMRTLDITNLSAQVKTIVLGVFKYPDRASLILIRKRQQFFLYFRGRPLIA